MPDEPPVSDARYGTHDQYRCCIVSAATKLGRTKLPVLISTVHQALVGLGKSETETEGERTLAVPIRRSIHRDYLVCLECGWRGQMLRRHLATGHRLSVQQCRARWKLTREHEMTAPVYSERRSGLATTQDLVERNR